MSHFQAVRRRAADLLRTILEHSATGGPAHEAAIDLGVLLEVFTPGEADALESGAPLCQGTR